MAYGMSEQRFRDPDAQIWGGIALVVCPRCAGAARASDGSVQCGHCGFARLPDEPRYAARTATLVHSVWHPRCSKCGGALPKVARAQAKPGRTSVSVKCKGCGHNDNYPVRPQPQALSVEDDPDSGLPYFLSFAVGRHVLWARNIAHLDLIEAYVNATLRERALQPVKMTQLARLPAWIKSAANRENLRKAIKSLRASAARADLT